MKNKPEWHISPGPAPTVYMGRVGKKAAGRLLDGVQHDGYPQQGGS